MIAVANILTTILSIVICILSGCVYAGHPNIKNKVDRKIYAGMQNEKGIYGIIGILLLVFAAIIRIWKIGQLPDALNQDSAFAAVNAYSLMKHGYDVNGVRFPIMFSALNNTQMSILLSVLMIPFIKLLGYNNLAIVMPNLILNIIGLVAGYYLIRKTFGTGLAMAYAAVAICNPWSYIQSRWPLDANLFPHCFTLCVLLLFTAVTKKNRVISYFSAFMFGIAHYCYGVSLYVIPIFLLIVFIWLLRQHRISVMDLLLSACFYLLSSWPFYLTIIVNMFQINSIKTPLFTIPYFPNGARQGDILITGKDPAHQFFLNSYSICKVLIFQKDELIWSYVPGFGTLMPFIVPFMITGIIVLLRGRKIKDDFSHQFITHVLIGWLIVTLIAGAMTKDTNSTRLNIALPLCLIMSGIGVYFTCITLKYIIIVVSGLIASMSGIFLLDYFTIYQERFFDSEYAYSGNFTEALEKAHSYNAQKYVITPDSQYYGAKDVSEVDTLYIWKIDTDYKLGITNDGPDGKKIPYLERFQYINVPQIEAIDSNDTIYVSRSDDLSYFNEDSFNIYKYQDFMVAVPKTIDRE